MSEESARGAARRRINTQIPHSARVWDYWLGGTENYPADREVGDQILRVMPDLPVNARAERQFIRRVVRYLAGEAGVVQFLDIGTGIPTAGNTHEIAQSVNPAARIVYVDNDPVVLIHARELLHGSPEGAVDYIDADLRNPEPILQAATETLDFTQPIALLLMGVLEFVPDDEQARAAVRTLLHALPRGSYLGLAHSVHSPSMDEAAARWNASDAAPIMLRTPADLEMFFEGLELMPPGVVSLPKWHPDATTQYTDREVYQYGGLGRKP
ncbi:hypothetical protein HNP84_004107 [Thermocatellispora tengchongensis]|uniref:S-adenosyl methyltransferase n=1 Tax=Thermocatellispora tengchongensis TaxID=1073253 RepID=A0A840PEA9_9ACTN|nr:SAM-dependent methyltransferase [Thermocatellispora tengchongensis]MBB5134375.1 hypothetical protein [Thermocatellispora tengchongensis]